MIRTYKHIAAALIAAAALVLSVITALAAPASADAPFVTITSVDVTSAPTGSDNTNIVVRGTGFLTAEVTGVYIGTEFEPSHQDVNDTEIDLHTAGTLPSGTYPFYLQSAYNGNFYGPDFTYYDPSTTPPSTTTTTEPPSTTTTTTPPSTTTSTTVPPSTTTTTVPPSTTTTTTPPAVVKPVIASITPNRLSNDGGQPIVISGKGFTGATGVVVLWHFRNLHCC